MPFAWRVASLAVVCLCAPGLAASAAGQYFGRNKVEYTDFDFQVQATEHFDIHHYPREAEASRLAARLAERWYARLSRVLDHELAGRQPLVLYGNHSEFTQTNVVAGVLGEGIGGVTESMRRRIVMPFAPTLAETDQVLGHEIVHAFQFDMIRRYRGHVGWPSWFIEGMAQYLSLGSADRETAMWLRDAVAHDLLPRRLSAAGRTLSPYRFGHAFWTYLAGRFGDPIVPAILKAAGGGSLHKRFRTVTGVELDQLYAEWRQEAGETTGTATSETGEPLQHSVLPIESPRGRLHLGPALSPDARQTAFFSERDRLSIDLFLAATDSGTVERKLATTAANDRYESLQPLRSSGSWSFDGQRFVFAVVSGGEPALVLVDLAQPARRRHVVLPGLGQILTPAWSPDGRQVAFTAFRGGTTDLYVYEVERDRLRQLTHDVFADLQPSWSPDGRQIAFATDRFSSDPASLRFGRCALALLDVATGTVRAVPALGEANTLVNPQWSPDGSRLYFVGDPGGVPNVFRLDLDSGWVARITDVPGGVTGLTTSSPALAVAARAPALVFVEFSRGQYHLRVLKGAALAGAPFVESVATTTAVLPPVTRAVGLVDQILSDSAPLASASHTTAAAPVHPYRPGLGLEAIGQPYVSSGGGPFGTFVRGGGSVLFGDLLGERRLAATIQVGNHLRDLALAVRYLNRGQRWNRGAIAELQPSFRRLPARQLTDVDGRPALVQETKYLQRIQGRVGVLVTYPLSRTRRVELGAGVRHAWFEQNVRSRVVSLGNGRLLSEATSRALSARNATVGEISAALVGDSAVMGPTGPLLGSRYRFEIAPARGDLSVTQVLADYRRYLMPLKPYTIAVRAMHLGQYGPDAVDPRLFPTFLGSRQFVRGYGWGAIKCEWNAAGECGALDDLLGTRVAVGNVEVRVPLAGLLSRDLRYGPLPLEAFAFADAGLVWSRPTTSRGADRRLVRSIGSGVRINAGGLPLELVAVHALDAPARGWSFDFSFRQGF